MECELLRSPMISYRSLLYNTTVLYDILIISMHSIPLHSTNALFNLCMYIVTYRIAKNSGGEKLWRISNFQLLARKTLANARSCSIGWGKILANHTSWSIAISHNANRSQWKSFVDRSVIAKLFELNILCSRLWQLVARPLIFYGCLYAL